MNSFKNTFFLKNKFQNIFDTIIKLEDFFFRDDDVPLKNPIFITGMPRSGTTLLTHILHDTEKYGSFLYKDYPFPEIPLLWNKVNNLYYKNGEDQKRIHDDDLLINKDSPENLDEFLWKGLFQNHFKEFDKLIDENFSNIEFEHSYIKSIKKVLFVRKKNQYLAKNNYIIFRIKYLLKFIPSAKFIICVRNPNDTCYSLEKIHKRFLELNKIKKYKNFEKNFLHYEFGNSRRNPNVSAESQEIDNLWRMNKEFDGYMLQWITIYDFIIKNYQNLFGKKILILDYDGLRNDYPKEIKKISQFLNVDLDSKYLKFINKKSKEKKYNQFSERAEKIYEDLKNFDPYLT